MIPTLSKVTTIFLEQKINDFFVVFFIYTFLIPNKGNLLNYYLLSVSINVEKKKIMFNLFEHKLTQSINPKIILKISKKKPINDKKKS